MVPESLEWAQVNWAFSLALLCLTYALIYWKESRSGIFSLAVLYLLAWGVWRLISNNLLGQWGLSALNVWTLGEWEHGLPNIDLTILGWIMFGFMFFGALGSKKQSKEQKVDKQQTEEEITQETMSEEVSETKEKKTDDLFDDI